MFPWYKVNLFAALDTGANAYLVKPVKMQELQKAIEENLKQQGDLKKDQEKIAEYLETRAKELNESMKPKRNKD